MVAKERWGAVVLVLTLVRAAAAVNYADFPADLRVLLDQRLASLHDSGGICIAGRVTMDDGRFIRDGQDVLVNLHHAVDEPCRIYPGGWFIMSRTLSSYYAGTGRGVVVRAFGYDPIDASVTVLDGYITYLDFVMYPTPEADLASIRGRVIDENSRPFNNARVLLDFPFASFGIGTQPLMELRSDATGYFEFTGLSITDHSLAAFATGYAYHLVLLTPPVGGVAVQNLKLYPNRRITIDYVYQANGSRSFTSGSIHTGTIDWLNGVGGVDFSAGAVEGYDPNDLRDLDMRQVQDVLEFDIGYATGYNGFYDAGAVDFDSVVEAAATYYPTQEKPCLVGHVYVVRTYEENNYAKFLVTSDESSFRTVIPGDPAPIEFAGYGLTIDFTYSGDFGRVYVAKTFAEVPGLGPDALPYYLDISGIGGAAFTADLIVRYDEADVVQRRLFEHHLVLLQSTDRGRNWVELATTRNWWQNKLTVEGLTSFGYFAIADLTPETPGDLDDDGDVDLKDVARFQQCFTGFDGNQTSPACVGAMFDADDDVDRFDFAGLYLCITAPGVPGNPACAG